MDSEEQTLRLPDGYTIGQAPNWEEKGLLALRRADSSAVALFEFSAFGPDPRRIWEIAWDDAEGSSSARSL